MSRDWSRYMTRPALAGAMPALRAAALAGVGLLAAGRAAAVEGTVGFGLGSQYSDNVNLAPKGAEQSAWMEVGSVSMAAGNRTDESEVRVGGTLDYVNYLSGPFNNDFILSMNGSGNWRLTDSTKWYAEDTYNQMTVNALAAPIPSNRQDVNAFTTGPEMRLPLSRAQMLVAGARYENIAFAKTDTSSQRIGGYARWLYALGPQTNVSANVEPSRTDFTSRKYPDFTKTDLFLRLDHRWQRASVELDGGRTYIDRSRLGNVSGSLGRFGWHMPFNTHSGVDLYITHEYTDVGTDILDTSLRPNATGINNVTEQVSGNVFYSRQSELAWHWRGMFSTLRVAGAVRDENYKSADFNRRYEDGAIDYGYELTEDLLLSLDGTYRRAEYHITNQVNTDRAAIATFTYKINTRTTANFQAAHTVRDSTFAGAAFTENRFFVSIGYNQRANPQQLPGTVSDTVSAPASPGAPINDSSMLPGTGPVASPTPSGDAAGTGTNATPALTTGGP